MQERKVCSCIYILDPAETMTPQEYEESYNGSDDEAEDEPEEEEETEEWRRAQDEKRLRMDQFARLDAVPYLCNGFYQDEKVAHLGGNAALILIAAISHWNQPLKSQSPVDWAKLYVSTVPPTPVGRDAEMKELTKEMCEDSYTADPEDTDTAQELLKFIMNVRNETRVSAYKTVMSHYIRQGGSSVFTIDCPSCGHCQQRRLRGSVYHTNGSIDPRVGIKAIKHRS